MGALTNPTTSSNASTRNSSLPVRMNPESFKNDALQARRSYYLATSSYVHVAFRRLQNLLEAGVSVAEYLQLSNAENAQLKGAHEELQLAYAALLDTSKLSNEEKDQLTARFDASKKRWTEQVEEVNKQKADIEQVCHGLEEERAALEMRLEELEEKMKAQAQLTEWLYMHARENKHSLFGWLHSHDIKINYAEFETLLATSSADDLVLALMRREGTPLLEASLLRLTLQDEAPVAPQSDSQQREEETPFAVPMAAPASPTVNKRVPPNGNVEKDEEAANKQE